VSCFGGEFVRCGLCTAVKECCGHRCECAVALSIDMVQRCISGFLDKCDSKKWRVVCEG